MAETWSESKDKTQKDSEIYVIPYLRKLFGKDYIVKSVEKDTSKFAQEMDIYSGFDIVMRRKDSCVFGVASRIQPDVGFRSFTIRYERDTGTRTEYEKRVTAMKCNALRPTYNVHAYVNGSEMSIAVVRSDDLFSYLLEQEARGTLKVNHTRSGQNGGATFCYANWSELKRAGIEVWEWHGDISLLSGGGGMAYAADTTSGFTGSNPVPRTIFF